MSGIPVTLPPVLHHMYLSSEDVTEKIPSSLERYDVPRLWTRSKGNGIKVGVVDTGLGVFHNTQGDLKGSVADAKDFTGSPVGYADSVGHSTHVMGIIGGRQGNGIGIAGVSPECTMYCAKSLDDQGRGDDLSLAKGIAWCVEQGCKFINVSAGAPFYSKVIAEAIDFAISKGVLVIVAAGNDGNESAINFPARLNTTISVGAVDDSGTLAPFSCVGPEMDIAAPGVKILSCYKSGYAVLSGTSMSTPFVVGMAVLAASSGVEFTGDPDQFRDWLATATTDIGSPGQDSQTGYGLFDPSKVLKSQSTTPPKDPTEHGESVIDIGAILKKATGLDVPLKLAVAYPSRAGDLASISLKV